MSLQRKVKNLAKNNEQALLDIRAHLHQNPELSFKEINTSAFIKEFLKDLGVSYTEGWAEHGIVAIIKGKKRSSKVLALRADMDALPILEQNDKPYKSQIDGVMHACGHDVHSTCLMGAAKILNSCKEDWAGKIMLVFQPGEERHPGGASIMLKEKAFGTKYPSAILGQHVHPPLEVGMVGFKSGKYMASADEIYLEVIGRGGHAALPQDYIDPIVAASNIIGSLQTVVSRHSNPIVPAVLSFGKIYSDGGSTNVIPERVFIEGTFRTMEEQNRSHLHQVIKDVVRSAAKAMGAKAKVKILKGYPCLINDKALTAQSKSYAEEYLGKPNVVDLPMRMTAEDFAYYSQQMQACFYRLGTGNKSKGITAPVHHPKFDVDQDSLAIGAGHMAYQALRHLGN